MQHTPDDEYLESAINVYITLCTAIDHKRYWGEGWERDFSLAELEEMRDEAFRNIELHTVEHIEAVDELKRELNLV